MERNTSKIIKTKTKGNNRSKSTIVNNKSPYITELRKTRSKGGCKTIEKKLMVQLHHFANVSKSKTATKTSLSLTGESKALLDNDYFTLINSKQHKNTDDFVAKPFVINSDSDTDFGVKICCSVRNKTNNKNKFKDLVVKKFKAKDKLTKNQFAITCRDINSMINIKDYHRIYCKQIYESRLFINGLLVYDELKQHYSGVSVARNCLKKKFINKLEKVTKAVEMEQFKTLNINKDMLQNVIEFYDKEQNEVNAFNQPQLMDINGDDDSINLDENDNKQVELNLECDEDIENRSITPIQDIFSPDSFETPPDQRLIPVDLSATSVSKYQTAFYEKDATSGKAALFEVPMSFQVNDTNDKVNRSVLKRIDLSENIPSCSKQKGRVETARLVASGKVQCNDLDLIPEPGKIKKFPKKCLFKDVSCDDSLEDIFPLDGIDFVSPIYTPKQFSDYKKRMNSVFSPREQGPKKYLQSLKVDELDLKNISKIKSPEHRYFPFVQFKRN